tara:strand:- start:196 stop:735 length:540 start_codon:yes stop_codon:yes gene_type:complete
MKIIDNFLDKESFKKLQSTLLSDAFPWFYNPSKVVARDQARLSPIKGYESEESLQFTHIFLDNERHYNWSNWTDHMTPILDKIKPRAWIRVKASLSTINSKPLVGGWHYDMGHEDDPSTDTTTSILYINTNNGYTMFENGEKVLSLENRLVTFPNNVLHTGVSQTDTKIKITLNLNYLV